MSAEPIRKNVCDVDTNFSVTRLCYNDVLDENIYSLFALSDLQASQHETDKQPNKIGCEKSERHRLIFNYQLLNVQNKNVKRAGLVIMVATKIHPQRGLVDVLSC